MHKVKNIIASMLLLAPMVATAEPILITGEIASYDKQVVSAPLTDRWQIQIQWMFEEGAIAQQGDLIAVFDSGSIKSQIKSTEEQLASQQLVLKKKQLDLAQAVVVAEGNLHVANLEVQKAHIEASVNSSDVSKYDQGKYQLALERALLAKVKAEQQLKVKQNEQEVELAKQQIAITKLEENLAYQKQTLERASVKAAITGQVTHMMHPWNREKITAGTMVQQSMRIMMVQGQGNYRVQAWVHEIDVNKLKEGERATLRLDAFPEQQYQGKIEAIASQSEKRDSWSNSAYHRVILSFEQQPTVDLLPGMSVQVVAKEAE